jgi:hypothetical protein
MNNLLQTEISVIIDALKSQKDIYENAIKNFEIINGKSGLIDIYVKDIKEIETIIIKLKNQ